MKEIMYACVGLVAKIHNALMQLNNTYEVNFTDKELHFWIIGLLGLGMVFVIYPLFKYLAKKNHEMVITWIYVFTVIVVITFAIEIGQKITDTGNMEFADIMFGLVGFMALFFAFCFVRGLYHLTLKLIAYLKKRYAERKAQEELERKQSQMQSLEDLQEELAQNLAALETEEETKSGC